MSTDNSHLSNRLVHDHPHPLRIAIVGAGIGGLSAAIGLRRNGHQVELYEQSRLASETGAAVHLAPNANGILRRWGIFSETFGGTDVHRIIEYTPRCEVAKDMDVRASNKMWQHPWHTVHRVALHEKLKSVATGAGTGPPATLHTASRVIDVDTQAASLTLADGTKVEADVVIGADGIYSATRKFVSEKQPPLVESGKAAFRFLLPRSTILEDPVTARFAEPGHALSMWFDVDRRLIMYPCNDDQTLNFVAIHPDSESHAVQSDEWNKTGTVEQLIKVYERWDPAVKKLLSKADPAELKVWRLLDTDKLPSWTKGRLALIGDAAHPFTPHQGQGAGQAMEDAAALSAVLPQGTHPEDIEERLSLYQEIRYERAHKIQGFSRQMGRDASERTEPIDMQKYTAYNFGHDAADHAADVFKRWLWARKPDMYWRMPVSFGPFPGPRQDALGRRQPSPESRSFRSATVTFRTSRTYLETLFPGPLTASDGGSGGGRYRFASPATVATASFTCVTVDGMSWLGGGGYSHCGLYVHGVEYVKSAGAQGKDQDGVVGNNGHEDARDVVAATGTFMPVLFENLADPIISGREELGMNKLYADIDIEHVEAEAGAAGEDKGGSYRATLSWRGTRFLELQLNGLRLGDAEAEQKEAAARGADYKELCHRYVPAVGRPGRAEAEYACVVSHAEEGRRVTPQIEVVERAPAGGGERGGGPLGSVRFEAGSWATLPTLHHVAAGLAGIPVYEVVDAKVVRGRGVPDMFSARRV